MMHPPSFLEIDVRRKYSLIFFCAKVFRVFAHIPVAVAATYHYFYYSRSFLSCHLARASPTTSRSKKTNLNHTHSQPPPPPGSMGRRWRRRPAALPPIFLAAPGPGTGENVQKKRAGFSGLEILNRNVTPGKTAEVCLKK